MAVAVRRMATVVSGATAGARRGMATLTPHGQHQGSVITSFGSRVVGIPVAEHANWRSSASSSLLSCHGASTGRTEVAAWASSVDFGRELIECAGSSWGVPAVTGIAPNTGACVPMEAMNRNGRKPKKANKGARPCSSVARRAKKRLRRRKG